MSNVRSLVAHTAMQPAFTARQGQYLAFIYHYSKVNRRPPAGTDIQKYFAVSAPTVHQMVIALETAGHLERTPGALGPYVSSFRQPTTTVGMSVFRLGQLSEHQACKSLPTHTSAQISMFGARVGTRSVAKAFTRARIRPPTNAGTRKAFGAYNLQASNHSIERTANGEARLFFSPTSVPPLSAAHVER